MNPLIEIDNKSQGPETIKKTANRKEGRSKHLYHRNLIGAISNYTAVPENLISLYSDNTEALRAIIQLYVKDGDNILVINRAHAKEIPIDPNNITFVDNSATDYPHGVEPKAIVQKVNEKTTMVHLANPDKFGGRGRTVDEIEYLLKNLYKAVMVVDEEYFEFYGISSVKLVRDYKNLFIIRSCAPTLRLSAMGCSYVITQAENQEQLGHNDSFISLPALSMIAAETALRNTDIIKRQIDIIRENMAWLSTRLRSRSIKTISTPTEYLLLCLPHPEETIRFLKNWGIDVIAVDEGRLNQVRLALRVGDDKTSRSFIEAFDRIPKEIGQTGERNSTLTIRRGSENSTYSGNSLKTGQENGQLRGE